jgi:UDP-N-acetylmuramoyl-tripeptide--D-alanyl-D-alanine ligase
VATFGLEATGASVRGTDVRLLGFEGSEMTVTTSAGAARVHVPLAGPGNLANVLAAITVATEFGVPMDAIVPAVSALRPMAQRGRVERLAGGVTLVDDSYNSNPAALAQALAVVAGESRCGRKVAVLGEMLELGERAVVLHERSGRAVAAAGIDWLIAVGGEPAGAMARAAVAAGLPAVRVEHVATSQEAAEKAAALVRPGDLVFVKGSRGVKTERVAERIRADFA